MIPLTHQDNFDTLSRAFDDGTACLLEGRERKSGRPAYVICSTNRETDYQLVPFARLCDDNAHALLSPPGQTSNNQPSTDGAGPCN
jgi:hypothetical protein